MHLGFTFLAGILNARRLELNLALAYLHAKEAEMGRGLV